MTTNVKHQGLRTVVYKVNHLSDAKEWYSKLFDTKPYFDEDFYVGFNIASYELGLLPMEGVTERDVVVVNQITYWGVNDIKKMKEKCLSIGATIHEDITNVGGPIELFSINDPWSNCLGFIYNPTFSLNE